MKASDSLIGAVLLALGLVVLWHVSGFPPVPGQPYGSALFPALAAIGLSVASFLLMLKGLLGARRADAPSPAATGTGVDDGAGAGTSLLPVGIVLASMGIYIALVDRLGFIICGTLLLAVLMLQFRVRPLLVLPIALVATLIIHTGFYRLLRVPLPWGVLQPVAW